jgi:hypothetical protein
MASTKEFEDREGTTRSGRSFVWPCNRNGYRYCHSNDEALIASVETLWMILHKRTQIPNTQMINKVEAHGIVYERKRQENELVCFCNLDKM